jgi:hypothetical protein
MGDTIPRWPIRPALLCHESFSSWFCRVAWANGLSPTELYAVTLPGARLFRLDLDRTVADGLLAGLEDATGVSAIELRLRTFHHWSSTVFGEDTGLGRLRWLASANAVRHRSSFGQQVCHECLAEAPIPHMLVAWRLGVVHSCPVHRRLLLDRCSACGSPIQPLTASAKGRFEFCSYCGQGFMLAQSDLTDDQDLAIQTKHLAIADGDASATLGTYGAVHPIIFFEVLRLVYRLLATGRFSLPLRHAFITGDAKERDVPEGIPRLKEVDRLNPRCRRLILRLADAALANWPVPFMEACAAIGIHTAKLIKDSKTVPFPFWDPVVRHLSAPLGNVTREDINAAKQHLKTVGKPATYRELRTLLDSKFAAQAHMCDPVRNKLPARSSRYWKLDGVSLEVRQAVRVEAARAGENVGGWVDRVLRDSLRQKLV